jgi:hypothetical protein
MQQPYAALRVKSENAIQAHKMLACSIMPPPVAREVFAVQWWGLRGDTPRGEGGRAAGAPLCFHRFSARRAATPHFINHLLLLLHLLLHPPSSSSSDFDCSPTVYPARYTTEPAAAGAGAEAAAPGLTAFAVRAAAPGWGGAR